MTSADKCAQNPACIGEMMRRLGIEPGSGALPPLDANYIAAFRRCETCPTSDICREWLEQAPQALTVAPKFCPNADVFFELQFEKAGPRAFTAKSPPDRD